jgi:hypothetical protein
LRFATVTVIGSGWLLSSNKVLPMLGTLGQALSPANKAEQRSRAARKGGGSPENPSP